MSKKNGWMLPAALGALVLLSILIFYIPVRQPDFLADARQVHLSMSELYAENGKAGSSATRAEPEADALAELTAILGDCRYYRTLKFFDTLDGATTYHGNTLTVSIAYISGETPEFHSISLHGEYLHFDHHLWRLRGGDVDKLQQTLKDFILEHSEE